MAITDQTIQRPPRNGGSTSEEHWFSGCKAKGSNPGGRWLKNCQQIKNPDPRQVKASESFPKDHAPPKVQPMSIAGLTTGADGR